MTVADLREILEEFDGDMIVRIGMEQSYGSNFAMSIAEVDEHTVDEFYGEKYRAIVLTEGDQIGIVNYDEDEDYEEEEYNV